MSLSSIIFEEVPSKHPKHVFGKGLMGDFTLIILKGGEYDGYVNASKLCATYKKEYFDWQRNTASKKLIKKISTSILQEVDILIKDVDVNLRGYYVHPKLLTAIASWINPEFVIWTANIVDLWRRQSEENNNEYFEKIHEAISKRPCKIMHEEHYCKILMKELASFNPLREVKTPAGKIDILTDLEVIEVKHYKNWKHALGQVLAYSTYYPEHTKVIYLFGNTHRSKTVLSCCTPLNILVKWIDDEYCDREATLDSREEVLDALLENSREVSSKITLLYNKAKEIEGEAYFIHDQLDIIKEKLVEAKEERKVLLDNISYKTFDQSTQDVNNQKLITGSLTREEILYTKTVAELKTIAIKLKIQGHYRMNKAELVSHILYKEANTNLDVC